MRFFDAIASLQLGKKKDIRQDELCTVWSEQADDGPEAVPLGEYPRPQMVRDNWRCLNGWWDYAITRGETQKKTRPLSCDGKILVPFSPETARSGVGRTVKPGDTLWYSRKFDGIHLAKGERALLHFGAVDERCVVWVNGIRTGRHRNGYLPFTFEITEALRQGTNEITIAVRDDSDEGTACRGKQSLNPGGMFYHAQSGIWQTVWLEKVPEMYIKEICVTPNLSEQTAEFELYLSENVETNVSIRLLPEGTSVAGVIHEARGKGAKLTLPVPNPHYWTPEDPHERRGLRLLQEQYRSFRQGCGS